MGMDVGVFKFLVVGLDASRMNEVCNLINYRLFYYYYYHYYYYYYYHINFAKCNDISLIFEFFCVIYTQTKKIRPIFMVLYLLIQLRCLSKKLYQNVYQTPDTQKLVII